MSSSLRISAFDGLRCIAVGLVCASHAVGAYLPEVRQILWLLPFINASLGVRLFFVLSGFLITSLLIREQSVRGRIDWKAFIIRRSLRIWPALYAYILIILVWSALGVYTINASQFVSALSLTWNYASFWIPKGINDGTWLFGHLWTLALEQQFYIAWPFLIAFSGWKNASRLAIVAPLTLPVIRIALYYCFPDTRSQLGIMFHTAIDPILIGCIFALHQAKLRTYLARQAWLIPAVLIFAFVISPLLDFYWRPYNITLAMGLDGFCCGVLILAIQKPHTFFSRMLVTILTFPLITSVGIVSYSLYLWQQPFLVRLNSSIALSLCISICATVIFTLASFYLVERPMLRAKDFFSRSSLS